MVVCVPLSDPYLSLKRELCVYVLFQPLLAPLFKSFLLSPGPVRWNHFVRRITELWRIGLSHPLFQLILMLYLVEQKTSESGSLLEKGYKIFFSTRSRKQKQKPTLERIPLLKLQLLGQRILTGAFGTGYSQSLTLGRQLASMAHL